MNGPILSLKLIDIPGGKGVSMELKAATNGERTYEMCPWMARGAAASLLEMAKRAETDQGWK